MLKSKTEGNMSKKLPKIGIIGFGFVGSAVAHGFGLHANILISDKYQKYSSLKKTVNKSKFLFVCVPTPMRDDGSQDTNIVWEVVRDITQLDPKDKKIIIIKSTVLPGTCRRLQEQYPEHPIVHNPEFLTERTYKLDFINTARIILGLDLFLKHDLHFFEWLKSSLEELFRPRFPHTPMYFTSWEGAEFVKYMCNGFFSLKVSFLNECYDIAKRLDIPFDELKNMFLADMRIGNSHTDVPGYDGQRGFGGKCFPKDTNAITKWAQLHGLCFNTLESALVVNERVRKVKDWEEIKGATTKNMY